MKVNRRIPFRIVLSAGLAWFILLSFRPADTYPKNLDLDVQHYVFDLILSDETDEIFGTAAIEVRFQKAGLEEVVLDLINQSEALEGKGMTVESVHAGEQELKFSHKNDQLRISLAAPSQKGDWVQLKIRYHGVPATGLIIAPNKYGDRCFFSDNWPNKARNWLPTVDHPYDKASCEFIVTAPGHYQVISNGLKMEETNLDAHTRRTHWKQSVPIATWLYVLGVAEFAVQYMDTFEGKSIQTWVYKQDRDVGFYDFAVPTKHTLEFFSDYVGPFAYEKLANIQSNSVGGGMEAATAIFYGDNSVTGERTTRWRNVIIHEVAHQWFGNAVTEFDWDDVWLSEGFATYFTLLFIEHAYGRDEFVSGLKSSRRRVFSYYRDHPDYRIVHDNLQDMRRVTSSQTYQKGAWILHMLRSLIGDEAFQKGVQDYYRRYKNQNASTADFKQAMEVASGLNLDAFCKQWLYRGGNVVLKGAWKYNEAKQMIEVELNQVQNDGYEFKMPVELGVYRNGRSQAVVEKVDMESMQGRFSIPSEVRPDSIRLDPRTVLLAEWRFSEKE